MIIRRECTNLYSEFKILEESEIKKIYDFDKMMKKIKMKMTMKSVFVSMTQTVHIVQNNLNVKRMLIHWAPGRKRKRESLRRKN